MSNKVLFGQEAYKALKNGMDIVHQAVASTIGAGGRNVVYNEYGRAIITNDGVSIAKKINLKDEAESMGADLLKQAAERTDEEAGDGTSTAIVLAHAMVEEGMKKVNAGVNPMQLRREMEEAASKIVEELKFVSRPVASDDELLNVANISVENVEIAKIIRDAAKHAGIEGEITVDESTGTEIEMEKVHGMKFDHGYLSPYMITDPNKMEAVLTPSGLSAAVPILITDKAINMVVDIEHLWEKIGKEGHTSMLIIAGDVTGEALASFITTRIHPKGNRFLTCCVKKPYNREFLDDIAALTGGEALTEDKGISKFTDEHYKLLGFADKVIVTKDHTIIVGGHGNKEAIDERMAGIKDELDKAEVYEKNILKTRLARLKGGVVVIKVGAHTDAEMKYLKRKIDDAVNATRAAMEEGIVVGGGKTMYTLSKQESKTDGEEVIRKAMAKPIRKIIENAGGSEGLEQTLKAGEIYNALTGEICVDPIKEGIIDPVKVERCALVNAVSIVAAFLTAGSAIIEIPEKTQERE